MYSISLHMYIWRNVYLQLVKTVINDWVIGTFKIFVLFQIVSLVQTSLGSHIVFFKL